jgi:hypothetical protein
MVLYGRLARLSDLSVELLGVLVNMNGVEEEVLVERLVVVPHHPPVYQHAFSSSTKRKKARNLSQFCTFT